MLDMLMMMLLCIRSLCCAALQQSSQTHFRRNISQQTSPRANRFPPETGMCRPFTRPSSDMLTVRVRCARLRKVEATGYPPSGVLARDEQGNRTIYSGSFVLSVIRPSERVASVRYCEQAASRLANQILYMLALCDVTRTHT
jgi:hypothetical protein